MKKIIDAAEAFMAIAYMTNKRGNTYFGACVVDKTQHIIDTIHSGTIKKLKKDSLKGGTAYVVVFSVREAENLQRLVDAVVKEIICFKDEHVKEEVLNTVTKIAKAGKVKLKISDEVLRYIYVAKNTNIKPISDDEYFTSVAYLISKQSYDPSTQVGAVIVDKNKKIIGTGFNGVSKGWNNEEFPWDKKNGPWLDTKFPYVIHGEVNAILNSIGYGDLKGATVYTTIFPWNEHAKIISQSGIKELVFLSDEDSQKEFNQMAKAASKRIFDKAGVKYRQIDVPLNWLI